MLVRMVEEGVVMGSRGVWCSLGLWRGRCGCGLDGEGWVFRRDGWYLSRVVCGRVW